MSDDDPEVTVGPFFFEYDEKRREMFVGVGEEVKAMIEHVGPDQWQEFVEEVDAIW